MPTTTAARGVTKAPIFFVIRNPLIRGSWNYEYRAKNPPFLTPKKISSLLTPNFPMYLIKTTDLTFMSIAHLCGYANADNLAKVMQKRLKMPPFEYRYN